MADVTPTAPVSTATAIAAVGGSGNSTATTTQVNVTSLPDQLQTLLRQIEVPGTIAQTPNANEITITTQLGTITLSLPQIADAAKQKLVDQLMNVFDSQKTVTLTVQPGTPPTQGFLQLPSTGANAGAGGVTTPVQITNVTQTAPVQLTLPPLAAGQSLTAIILPPDGFTPTQTLTAVMQSPAIASNVTMTAPAISADANGGVSVPVSGAMPATTQVTPPASNTTPQESFAPNQALPNIISTTTPTAAPTTTAPQLLSGSAPSTLATPPNGIANLAGQQADVQIISVSPPGSPAPTPTAANQINATVIGTGPSGQVILKTADAVLYVKQRIAAPVGSSVLLTVTAERAPDPVLVAVPKGDTAAPGLQQMLVALNQIDPALAQRVLEFSMPQPNELLPGAIMFFMSAFKQGGMRGWIGDNAVDDLVKAGKLDLLTKLAQDLSPPDQPLQDPTIGAWRNYPIPFNMAGQFQTLQLHVHQDGGNKDETDPVRAAASKRVRFLIDVRMTRLGAIQLDGLTQTKKLDMIVRSEAPLPLGLPQSLRDSYKTTLEALGYTGGLSFQSGRQNWLNLTRPNSQSIVT